MTRLTPSFTLKEESPKLWSLTFDLPGEKVNKLSLAVLSECEELLPHLEKLEGKADALVLFSGKPGTFIAGADIEIFASLKTPADGVALCMRGHAIFNRWEDLAFPTVAAVDGAALGGGCEFALASTAIAMSTSSAAKIGLPEIMLGVLPGLGGCVRMPRKLGLATALDLILSSRQLDGERAFKAGLTEAVLQKENFREDALAWTRKNLALLEKARAGARIAKEPKLGATGGAMGSVLEKTPFGRAFILKKAREGVISKTKGHYPAPIETLDVIRDIGARYGERLRGKAREKAQAREAEGFGKLVVTEASRNLVRLFYMTEAVKKSKGLPPGVSAEARGIRTGAVLGAGVMGGGIAHLFADKGLPIRMKDLNAEALGLGVTQASRIFKKQVSRRRLTPRQAVQKLGLISPVLDYSGFMSCDAVIEAIVEKMDVKKKVLAELEAHVDEGCVIASNTSSLSISEMQTALKHPERFGGMHFFNPVAKMPLIEVIRGEKTSDETVSAIFELSKRLGKTPIVVKDAPGFLVNRLLLPYMNEATWLLADGVPIPDVDRVLRAFGMPMGPIELIDEVGIDVGEKVAHILHDAFGARMLPAPFNEKVVKAQRLGKKNGKGFYIYENQGRDRKFDPAIYEVLGLTPHSGALSDEEILERCLLPMINEATRCLEENVVASPAEVDLGMIMGTGFPPFRGGLLRYADTLGAVAIVEKLGKYQARFGVRYEPAPALIKRAKNSVRFYP